MRVALYARVSSDEQAAAGRVSLPAQLRVMRERCERDGWDVVRVFEAPGESAYTDDLSKRPTLQAAIEAAERGEFDVLMVHESSRFARNALLALTAVGRLNRAGVALLESTEPLTTRTAESGLFFLMKSGSNEYYSEKIGEHLRKAKAQLFAEGLHVGDAPFGYRRVGARLPYEVVPVEAEAIRIGFRKYIAGASYTEIAREWNAAGLRPRSKQGHTAFTVPAMQTIFENDFYCGYVRHKGARKVGAHEAIVSEEEWQAAQARPERRASRSRNYRLLSGVLSCGECLGPVWITNRGRGKAKPFYYYIESSKARGRECAAKGRVVSALKVEAQVDAVVRTMTRDAEWLRRVARDARRAPSVDVSGERERVASERKRVTNAYIAGAIEEGEWRSRVASLDARLDAMGPADPEGVVFGGERLAGWGQLWDVASEEEKREGLRLMFERVVVEWGRGAVAVRPWGELLPYFDAKRAEIGRYVGPPGIVPSNQPTRLYRLAELVA